MATPIIIHCDGLRSDCLLGITVEQGWSFCEKCPINTAYKNGIKQGYHESEMWDRCPPQGSHIEYPNDGNYR